jgi:hypothetical protein
MRQLTVLPAFLFALLLAGCASSLDSRYTKISDEKCSRVDKALSHPSSADSNVLEQIALGQNVDVLLRKVKIEQYQSVYRLLDHLRLSTHPFEGIPFSLSGLLKFLTEIFRRQNPETDPELYELYLLLRKVQAEVARKMRVDLRELRAEEERLAVAVEDKRKAYADMVAANLIAKAVPILAAQEKLDKAQRAHAKAEDEVRSRNLKAGNLKTEILELTGCIHRNLAAQN